MICRRNVRVKAYAELVDAEIDRYSSFGFESRAHRAGRARLRSRRGGEGAAGTVDGAGQDHADRARIAARRSLGAAPEHGGGRGVALPAAGRGVSSATGRRLPRRRARRAPGDLPRADADRGAAGRRGSGRRPATSSRRSARRSPKRFRALRPAMVAALASPRPQTRANAAAVLGMAPSVETRTALEARLAVEPDARVRLVMAYALVHHGATERLSALTEALQSCQGPACTLPVMLLQWLPSVVEGRSRSGVAGADPPRQPVRAARAPVRGRGVARPRPRRRRSIPRRSRR